MHLVISISYRVVRREPSSRASDSIVMACAGQMASHNLQAGDQREAQCAPHGPRRACAVEVPGVDDVENRGGRLTDTSLFAVGVSSESVFASEPRRQRSLLERVHDRIRRAWTSDPPISSCERLGETDVRRANRGLTEELFQYDPHACRSVSALLPSKPQAMRQSEIEQGRENEVGGWLELTPDDLREEEQLASLIQRARPFTVIRIPSCRRRPSR